MKNYTFLIFILLFSCEKDESKDYMKPADLPFTLINIDNQIKNAREISELKKKFKTLGFIDGIGKEQKMKTTNVISVLQSGKEKPFTFSSFRCFATMENNDVKIYISYNTGLSGGGIKVLKKNEIFSIRPVMWNDIGGSEDDELFKINYQKLTLDKQNYKIGDSIFGKLDAEIVHYFPEVNEEFKGEKFHENEKFLKTKYSGYFQTIVKEKIYQ